MKYKSAVAGEERISVAAINKLGSYSYCSIKKNNSQKQNSNKTKCNRGGLPFKPNHLQCKAINSKCLNCSNVDHFTKVCCQQKTIKVVEDKCMDGTNSDKGGSEDERYLKDENVNLLKGYAPVQLYLTFARFTVSPLKQLSFSDKDIFSFGAINSSK